MRRAVLWIHVVCTSLFATSTSVTGQPSLRDVYATIGNLAVLPCVIDNDIQIEDIVFRVTWYSHVLDELLTVDMDRQSIDDRFSVQKRYERERNLLVQKVKPEDVGNYTCKITYSGQARELSLVRLVVKEPPMITEQPQGQEVVIGSDVTLTCQATGSPTPQITWFFSTLMDSQKQEVGKGEQLVLRSISRDQAGQYTCEAENNVPPAATRSATVNVQFAPVLVLPFRELRQPPDTDAFLTCLVHSHPSAEVYWELVRDAKRIVNVPGKYQEQTWSVGNYGVLHALYISALDDDDYGMYRCVAQNTQGTGSVVFALYGLNSTDIPSVPVLGGQTSSSSDSMVAVVIVISMLLGVAVLALVATLVALHRSRRPNFDTTGSKYNNCHEKVPSISVQSPSSPQPDDQSTDSQKNNIPRFNSSRKCTKM